MSEQKASITIQAYDKASYAVLGVASKLEVLNKKLERQSQLGYAFSQMGQQLAPAWRRMEALGEKWGSAFRRLSYVSAAVGGATAGLIAFAKSTTDAGDKVNDLSSRYQVGGGLIQLYGKMVEESGGSVEDAAVGIGKLKTAMTEAIHGDKEFIAAFAGVGISVEKLKKMKPDEVLTAMANAFKGSENDFAKQEVLRKLMGKGGTTFMDTMNRGGDKINQTYQQMIRNGEILDQQQLAISGRFSDTWDRMAGTMAGLKNRIGIELASRLEPLLQKFQIWLAGDGGKRISEEFNKIFTAENIKSFAETLLAIGKVIASVARGIKWMVDTIGPANTAFAGLAVVLAPVGGALAATATALFSAGRAIVSIGAAIPGVTAGLGAIAGMLAKIAPLAGAAFAGWAVGGAINDKISEKIKQNTGGESSSLGDWIYNRTHNQDLNSSEFGQFSWRKLISGQDRKIKNKIEIKINAEGRAKVQSMQSGSQNTSMDVTTAGLQMAGS